MQKLVRFLKWSVLAPLALCLGVVQAQGFPNKPIKIVVPFGPGGSGDITARAFGQYLEAQFKQGVVIENRAGANGILGTEAIKWNFTKFLIDRSGEPVARYAPQTKPEELEQPIVKLL